MKKVKLQFKRTLVLVLTLAMILPSISVDGVSVAHASADVVPETVQENTVDSTEESLGGSGLTEMSDIGRELSSDSSYMNDYSQGTVSLLGNSESDVVSEVTDEILFGSSSEESGTDESDVSVNINRENPEDIDYGNLVWSEEERENPLDGLLVDGLTAEELESKLEFATMNQIGEWLYNLEEDELDYVLSLDTSLLFESWVVYPEEEIIEDEVESMAFWEACEAVYFQSQISLFSWTDRFFGGQTGDAKFTMGVRCDGTVVSEYTVNCPNVVQPSDKNAAQLSLACITKTKTATCSSGHSIGISFNSIYAVTDSSDYWSGIRIFGSYKRPAGYRAIDNSYNDVASGTHGFGAMGYTRFGTSTYGELDFSNPYVIDANFYDRETTDEFCFEGNASQIGLFDGLGGYNINNYGRSHYYIDLSPAGKTYTVNPNGGKYNGSTSNTSYRKYASGDDKTTIGVPVWESNTEGKTFIGWDVSGRAFLADGTETGSVINTTSNITVWHKAAGNGKYRNEIDCSDNYYSTYIQFGESADAILKARWRVDWIRVYFDGNRPVDEPTYNVENINPTNKVVYVGQAYGTLPTPTLYGWQFVGWYTAPAGGVQVTSSTICNATETHTLYAHWRDGLFRVNFDTNKPKAFASSTVTGMAGYESGKDIFYEQAYGYLPGAGNNNWPTPGISGLTFKGWYTHPVGGVEIKASTTVTTGADQTVYARWDAELPLKTSVNLDYSPHTIGSRTFYKGGVYCDWGDYYKTDSYYNVYRQENGGSFVQITPGPPNNDTSQSKIKTKYWADTTANDKASPNAVNSGTVNISKKVGTNTVVTFSAPTDNGTTYNYFVRETEFYSVGYGVSHSYNSSAPAKAYVCGAPTTGSYNIETLSGGTSGKSFAIKTVPPNPGILTKGTINLTAGDTIYMVLGSANSGSSGGTNGGGSGGWYDRAGTGGGGLSYSILNAYNSYLYDLPASNRGNVLTVGGASGGVGGAGDDGEITSNGKASGGAGGTIDGNGNPSSGAWADSYLGSANDGNYRNLGGRGGGAGTQSYGGGGGAGGTRHGQDNGADDDYRAGSGGGGGAGYYGGGGGGGGALSSNGEHHGSDGGSGGYGRGGGGGNGAYNGYKWGYHSGGGGGGGAGSSYINTSRVTNKSVSKGSNYAGNGSGGLKLVKETSEKNLKESNYSAKTVTSGVVGYRYIIDTSAYTNVAYNAGTFVSSPSINVPNRTYNQYLHIAAQDRAGNVSGTIHVFIQATYTITYNLDGGRLPDGVTNPGGFTADTPTFTLNNPIQDGYEFIGWTGSNGSTPQMTVTIPQGSTGDRTYTANWAQEKPYVTDISLAGDMYKYATREFYVKCEQVFDIKFSSYVKNKAGTIIASPVYTPTNNYLNVKNKGGTYIQTRDSWMAMNEFKGYFGKWSYSTSNVLKINDFTLNTRTTTAFGSTNGYQYLNTLVKGKLVDHLDVVYIYPQAGVDLGTKINKSEQWDETKKVKITADGKAPVITDNIIDDGVYDQKILPIKVNIKDEDTGESGIKNLKVEMTNHDTGYHEVLANITNSSYVTSTGFEYINSQGGKGLILKDNENYVGKITIKITATDNVNNVKIVEKTVYVISLDTDIKRMLPVYDKDGNLIPDNVFKDGEQGELIIGTTGFIDKLEIIFDDYIQNKSVEPGYETKDDVVIPLPNNDPGKNQFIRTTPRTDPDTLKPARTDEYFFFIPPDTYIPNPSDPSDNIHYVIIKAHKEDKVLTNLILMGGAGPNGEDIKVPDIDIDIEGDFEVDLRTRIREWGR